MKKRRIILRVDGNSTIGFGHFFRCLSLCKRLANRYELHLVTHASTSPSLIEEVGEFAKVQFVNLPYLFINPDSINEANRLSYDLNNILSLGDILILDGYHFSEEFYNRPKERNIPIVVIDDFCINRHVNAIINQAPFLEITNPDFAALDHTYCGLEYSLISPSFIYHKLANSLYYKPICLICLGNFHDNSVLQHMIREIIELNEFEKIIVIGSQVEYSQIDVMSNKCHIKLYKSVPQREMLQLLNYCTHCVVSASAILMEAYFLGLTCFVVQTTENQKYFYEGFIKYDGVIGLGNIHSATEQIKKRVVAGKDKIRYQRYKHNKLTDIFEYLN